MTDKITNEELLKANYRHPDPNHCHKYNAARWRSLDEDRRRHAVDFVRSHLAPTLLADIKKEIEKDQEYWWVSQHFTWGVSFRNFLRQYGFGELNLRITDLDDYYLPILEIATMGDTWYDDVLQG